MIVGFGRQPLKKLRRPMRSFEQLSRSWSWTFDRHLHHFARQLGIPTSERSIVSACRRVGDTEVTMRALDYLMRAYGGTEDPPPEAADRRLARRALVAVACPDNYLDGLGLAAAECELTEADRQWESATRHALRGVEGKAD